MINCHVPRSTVCCQLPNKQSVQNTADAIIIDKRHTVLIRVHNATKNVYNVFCQ